MRRWVWPAVLAVLALAVAMRFLPLLQFEVWGSDTGEYYSITKGLVDTGALSTAYEGWGFGYPYFPGMFLLTGEVALVAGAGLFGCLLLVAPFVAGLSVLAIMLIALRAFEDIRAGLLAGAFLAVCTPAVFSTSHPIPGGVGDLLALLCILLLLRALESRAAAVGLGLSTLALVMTHHLSTFFVLVPVLFALLGRELLRLRTDRGRTLVEGGYLVFLLSVTLLWWYGYAVPFRERVIPEAFGLSSWTVLVLAYLLLLAIPLLVMLRRRLAPGWVYRPRFPSLRKVAVTYTAFVVGASLVLAAVVLLGTPGTTIQVDSRAAYWFLPTIALLGLAVAGAGWAEYGREGLFVLLWLGACGLSLAVGILTSNHVLLPYRQTQYFMAPLAVLMGAGAVFLHYHLNVDRKKAAAVGAAGLLAAGLALTAAAAYPPREIMGGFEEGTTAGEMDSVLWLRESASSGEMLATDHRMSSMAFGFAGVNATWDDAYDTLHGSLAMAEEEMSGLDTPSGFKPVTSVLLDPAIEGGVALRQWETARPLDAGAKAKFSAPVFLKVYEAQRVDVYLVDLSWRGLA